MNSEPKGYFELSDMEEWQAFKTFENLPNVNLREANVRMVDLNGDGRPEILLTEDHVFTWYPSAGRKGFECSYTMFNPLDEEDGSYLVFAESKQTIFLADMSGLERR